MEGQHTCGLAELVKTQLQEPSQATCILAESLLEEPKRRVAVHVVVSIEAWLP